MKKEATFTTEEVVALLYGWSSTRKKNPYRLHNFLDGKEKWDVPGVDGTHLEIISKRREALRNSLYFPNAWKYRAMEALRELHHALDLKKPRSYGPNIRRSYESFLADVIKHVGKRMRIHRI